MFGLKLKSLARAWECYLLVPITSLFFHGFATRAEERETKIKVQPQLYSHHLAKDHFSSARIKQDRYSLGNVCAS